MMPAQPPIARRETGASKTESGADDRERAIVNEFGPASINSNNQVSSSCLQYGNPKRAKPRAHLGYIDRPYRTDLQSSEPRTHHSGTRRLGGPTPGKDVQVDQEVPVK